MININIMKKAVMSALLIIFGVLLIGPASAAQNVPLVTCPPDSAAIKMIKYVDLAEAHRGDVLTYFIRVYNSSSITSGDIVVRDHIPEFADYVNGSANYQAIFDASADIITWNLPPLEAYQMHLLRFQVRVEDDAPISSLVINIANLISPHEGSSNRVETIIIPNELPSLLTVAKTVDRRLADVGDTLLYTIKILNSGLTDFENIIIHDTIPVYTEFVAGSADGDATYDPAGPVLIWYVATLAAGQEISFTFRVVINDSNAAGNEIRNFADIIAPIVYRSNPAITMVEMPDPTPRIQLTKYVDKDRIDKGGILNYYLRIRNSRNFTVSNVVVEDNIPQYTFYIPASATPGGIFDEMQNQVTWTIPAMAPYETIMVGFRVQVDIDAPNYGRIYNHGLVASPDSLESNIVETIILPDSGALAVLEITKQVDKIATYSSDTLTYSILVENNGDDIAHDINVTDEIPPFTTLVDGSITGGGIYYGISGAIVWTFDELWPGESMTVYFKVTVNDFAPDNDYIRNIATIMLPDSSVSDTVYTDIVPRPRPNLEIAKTVDLAEAYATDTVTYTIAISNTGKLAAYNVGVSDTIPRNTNYVAGSITGGGEYNEASRAIDWVISALAPGESASMQFRAYINAGTIPPTVIANIGYVLIPDVTKSDTAYTEILPPPVPDLHIYKSVDSAFAYAGDTLTYALNIGNDGTASASGILIYDPIPYNATCLIESINPPGDYNVAEKRVEWYIDELFPGFPEILEFKVVLYNSLMPGDIVTNIGMLYFEESVMADTVTTEIVPPPTPFLEIDKTADSLVAYPGDTVTYNINVRNSGSVTAADVIIFDPIPEHTAYVPGSVGPIGIYNNGLNRVDWNVGDLEAGENIDLYFKVVLADNLTAGEIITNIGSIILGDSTVADTVMTDIVLPPKPHLLISKEVDVDYASAGDTLRYTVSVKNDGTADAADVLITDTIPTHTTYIDGSASHGGIYDNDNRTIAWNLPTVAVGQEINLNFRVTIDKGIAIGVIVRNVAHVFKPDTLISDTTRTEIIPPPAPRLEIIKKVDPAQAHPGEYLHYNISLRNYGTAPAYDIILVDSLPSNAVYVTGSANPTAEYDEYQNTLKWAINELAIDASAVFLFEAEVDSDIYSETDVINEAYASYRDTTVADTVLTHITPLVWPELDIDKTVDWPTAASGDILTYTLAITNSGEAIANNVSVRDVIPNYGTYVDNSASHGGTYDVSGKSVNWTIPFIMPRVQYDVTFQISVNEGAPIGQYIINYGELVFPDSTVRDSARTLITPPSETDLIITKAVDSAKAAPGSILTYTVFVSNRGEALARNVVVKDVIPDHTAYISGSASHGGYYDPLGEILTWVFGTIEPKSTIELLYRARIVESAARGAIIENMAVMTRPINTQSNKVITIVDFPTGIEDVTIVNQVDKDRAAPHDTLLYTIALTNTEAEDVENIIVVDSIPDEVDYIPGSATGGGYFTGGGSLTLANGYLTWNVGTLAGFASVEYQFRAIIKADVADGTVILNQANILSPDVVIGNAVQTIVDITINQTPTLIATKSVDRASAMTGEIVNYTIEIENTSAVTADDVVVYDRMPFGFYYVENSSRLNGKSFDNPTSNDPYTWNIGSVEPGETVRLTYKVIIGASVPPGHNENVAWAASDTELYGRISSSETSARINIRTTRLPGAIRGRIIIDCDNDGLADTDAVPSGIDLFLDDGAQSRVNSNGVFYFSTVRAGEHVVTIDIRDFKGYRLADGQPASVFVHVHEAGESYIIFRVCPEAPRLLIDKKASLLPKVKVTKNATLNKADMTDTSGVKIDYEIQIQTNGGAIPTSVRVVDSFPDETRLVIHEEQALTPIQNNNVLTYDIMAGQERLQQSVFYSLEDLAPGVRKFLTNRIHLEGSRGIASATDVHMVSQEAEVSVGPFQRIPVQDIRINVTGAYFKTSKADLQPEAIPVLTQLVDSIQKYIDAPVKVEGHADYRRIHTREFPSNWELSTARAKAVADWLAREGGVDSLRLTYEGFAATRPVDTGHTEDAWRKNRRVEVFLKGWIGGNVELTELIDQRWSSWTAIELEPARYDTTFMLAETPLETGLDDTWEVWVTVSNDGKIPAKNADLIDFIPYGAHYIEGSATVDGTKFFAERHEYGLLFQIGNIEPGRMINVRYRIQADEGSRPAGGGEATIEVATSQGQISLQKSNPVTFK
jgi:uncharacterized repeat protein (TIGR01451 family)